MIREIINFTQFLETEEMLTLLNNEGDTKNIFYTDGDDTISELKRFIPILNNSWTIEYDKKPYYQKCFDLPNKRIHTVSPYIIAIKRDYLVNGKNYNKKGVLTDKQYVLQYLLKAQKETFHNNELSDMFYNIIDTQFDELMSTYVTNYEFNNKKIKPNNYVIILFDIEIKYYKESFASYLKLRLFNNSKDGITDLDGKILNAKDFNDYNELRGWSNFFNSYNLGKLFLRHHTGIALTNTINNEEAYYLFRFKESIRKGLLPNPLPIFIDERELNKTIIKIYNSNNEPLSYRELIVKLFSSKNINELSNFYLLFNDTRKSININDFDFVPLFKYKYNKEYWIKNIFKAGLIEDKVFKESPVEKINTVFDFERIVVKEIFNNSLVKIKENSYTCNYWNDIESKYVIGGDLMYQLIITYRKSFYDYIYKSATNAITDKMFDEIMFQSIYSNIHTDSMKGRCEWNNSIKIKLNIWFSLDNLFNNNTEIMASKIEELKTKMNDVANCKSNFDKDEEFAFGAGQIVSYLIDRSVAANKTYAMLEPYLQKVKSGLLQDAIAQNIALYKHDVSTYKGKFQSLASNVLTYDSNIDMKPLLKYFLAGCFSPCEIYIKETNN